MTRRAERGVGMIGLVGWGVIVAGLLGYQGFCLLNNDDRWPAASDILRDAMRYPAARWVLFGLWLWFGWHLFIRGWRFFLRT